MTIGKRFLVLACKVVHRGAPVPPFGEFGLLPDDMRECRDRFRLLPGLHFLAAARHEFVDGAISRASPQQPQPALGVAAHERALVAQPFVQERRIV
jgi:hypothetical protein